MKNYGVTEEDYELFKASNISTDSKEKTARNITRGLVYEEAFDTPQGQLLKREVDNTLLESLAEIVKFKHDNKLTLRQNYDNILGLILKHNIAADTKARWEAILKTKETSIKQMKQVSNNIRKNNGG
jgi:hypothetical protein